MSDLFGNHIVGFPTRRLIFADLAYKSSLENLEAARKSWEAQMEQACKVSQYSEGGGGG